MGCRLKRDDDARGALRLSELEGLRRRRSGGRQEKGLGAGAYVAEHLTAGEGIGDECDAPAAAAAVRTSEDVFGEGSLEELGPGSTIGGLVAVCGGGGSEWSGRDDAVAQRGGGREGTVIGPGVLAGMGDQGGELELVARYLLDNPGRTNADWDDDSPGLRYGFSWERAAAEFTLELGDRRSAYEEAMGRPDALDVLQEMEEAHAASPNPAAKRLGFRVRSAAISRRTAFMRLGLVEYALSADLGGPDAAGAEVPVHPLGHPVSVEVDESGVCACSVEPNGFFVSFELVK